MTTKLSLLWQDLKVALMRYPLPLTLALIAAILVVVVIELEGSKESFPIGVLLMCSLLGISLSFASSLKDESAKKVPVYSIVSLLILVGLYFYLPKTELAFTEPYRYLILVLAVLFHLLVSFLPFIGKKAPSGFWNYNKNLFIHTFLSGVFSLVLTLGVLLAIVSVDKLFELKLDNDIYPKTLFFLMILGSAVFFSLFNKAGLEELRKDSSYPQVLKFFTQFILIPLLLIYGIILYLYGLKILISWELPRGWVSYLILIYSVVGILALLLVHPLSEKDQKSWVEGFRKIFFFTLLPLLILLFVAIFTRVLEYGFTEPRYYVLALAIWLSFLTVLYILKPKAPIKWIPLSLFLLGLFTLLMPFLNAFSLSKNSQKKELSALLQKEHLLTNGTLDFDKNVTEEQVEEISSKFQFLSERNEEEFLLSFLSEKVKKEAQKKKDRENSYAFYYLIRNGFKTVQPTEKSEFLSLTLRAENQVIPTKNYTYVTFFRGEEKESIELEDFEFSLRLETGGKTGGTKYYLELKKGSTLVASHDLTPSLLEKAKPYLGRSGSFEVETLSETFTLGPFELSVHPSSLYLTKDPGESGAVRLTPSNLTVLLRKN